MSIVLSSLSPQPGCVKYEVVDTLFVHGSGDKTFTFNLPKCTIPKSHEASIVIKGTQVMVPVMRYMLHIGTSVCTFNHYFLCLY